MRKALAVSLLAVLLGGCASDPAKNDVGGIWINQVAIDAASKGGPLREALQAYGPNLEWELNTKAGQARYTNVRNRRRQDHRRRFQHCKSRVYAALPLT